MSNRPALNALQLLTSARWAIERDALARMVAIAERDPDAVIDRIVAAHRAELDKGGDPSQQSDAQTKRWALLAQPATAHAQSDRLGVRDGVAILSVVGPLSRYATMFTEICGMTSYQLLAEDFRIAVMDPSIRAIMVHLDSPGGETNGCAEMAQLIHAHRGTKPIVAMVSDAAASAAYWIAAACDEIVVSPSAYVGSIGVYWELEDHSERETRAGIKRWQIVSTQSPNKIPNPEDAAGKAVLQRSVDQFADAFVEAAARYRGTTAQALIDAGDGGAVFTGRFAVERGLADRVATTEDVLAELTTRDLTPASADSRTPTTTSTARAQGASAVDPAGDRPMSRTTKPTARAAGARAYAAGDEVRALIGREASIAEGATGTVEDMREGVTVLAVRTEAGDCRWLLADEEVELTAAAPADDAGASDDKNNDEPAASTTEDEEVVNAMAALRSVSAKLSPAQLAAAVPSVVGKIRAAAVEGERARVQQIAALEPRAVTKPMLEAISGGVTVGKAAQQFLASAKDPASAALAAMTGAEAAIDMPTVTSGADATPKAGAETVQLLQQHSPTQRRRALRARDN